MKQHRMVAALAAALAVLLLVEAGLLIHLRRVRADSRRHQERLDSMRVLAGDIRAARDQSGAVVSVGPGESKLDPAAVNRLAQERGIAGNIGAVAANPARRDGRLEEKSLNLTITAVSREDLAKFLVAVEKLDPSVRAKELRITPNPKQASLVDAKVQISAYESAKPSAK